MEEGKRGGEGEDQENEETMDVGGRRGAWKDEERRRAGRTKGDEKVDGGG